MTPAAPLVCRRRHQGTCPGGPLRVKVCDARHDDQRSDCPGEHDHRRRPVDYLIDLPLLRPSSSASACWPAGGSPTPSTSSSRGRSLCRLGDRPGVHLRQPRCGRDHGHVGGTGRSSASRPSTTSGSARSRDALPRRRGDAVLPRLRGAVGPEFMLRRFGPRATWSTRSPSPSRSCVAASASSSSEHRARCSAGGP